MSSTYIGKARLRICLGGITALLLCMTLGFAQEQERAPRQLTLLSGVSGGAWYPIGAGIAELFARQGVNANTEQGGGVSNVIAVGRGDAELGFTTSIIPPLAEQGLEPFPEPVTNARAIAVLWQDFTHVIVREGSDVEEVPDLAGKRFASQPVGTATAVAFANLLEAYGLSEDDLTLTRGGQSHGVDQVKDRNAVGVTATTAAPSGTLTELVSTMDVQFLEVNDEAFQRLREINPGFIRYTLEPGTYPNQEEAVEGVGTTTLLITREDIPDEEVYWITRTLVENVANLNNIHAALAGLTPEAMADVSGIPLHPGAERYYREAGLID